MPEKKDAEEYDKFLVKLVLDQAFRNDFTEEQVDPPNLQGIKRVLKKYDLDPEEIGDKKIAKISDKEKFPVKKWEEVVDMDTLDEIMTDQGLDPQW